MSIWNIFCCNSDSNEKQKPATQTVKRRSTVSKIQEKQPVQMKSEPFIQIKTEVVEAKTQIKSKETSPLISTDKIQKKIERKNLYEGQQLNGIPHGTGTMLYVNGDYYRGEWVNGLKEGRGIQNYFEQSKKYEGDWKQNQHDGEGKIIEQNGSYYQGQFKKGKKHGKGKYYDSQKKITYNQTFQHGALKDKNEVHRQKQKSQEFPTLVLDKQRFNTQDLQKFEDQNPEIQELQINFLLKYYGLCKIIHLPFIDISIVDWNISQVLKFLEQINLKNYRNIFYENKIKGKDLVDLEEEQMKSDLKMKLGDRKRLVNYIRYLENLNKPKKKSDQKKKIRRRGSFSLKQKDNVKKSILSVESRISEVENQDQCWKEENCSHSSKAKGKTKKNNIHNGFETEDWDKYNSIKYQVQVDYHSQNTVQQKKSKQSNQTIKGSKDNSDQSIQAPAQGKRKKSEDRQEPLANSLFVGFPKQKKQRQRSKSSSSNASSVSSLDSEMMKLKKKKTNTNGSQQIRQLYEFLRQNKSLDFIIKKKDIEIIEQIGQGGYGKVYRGKYMSCPVAVKDYMKAGRNHKSREDFMKQVYILSDLKHPNIVLYMGMCITVNQYQLVTEFLDNGSLFDQIHKSKTKFSSGEQFQIIDDIVKGMVYLHNMKNMIHKDLKSSNVLIAEDWKVKLCDFGLSGHKNKKKKKSQKNRVGTFQWMAPEVTRNQEIDFHSDVYSFGVIIWELLTEHIPYQGLSEAQITGLVGYDDKHRLPDPPEGSDEFIISIMNKCLQRKTSDRPTFIEIQRLLDEERLRRPNMKVDWGSK